MTYGRVLLATDFSQASEAAAARAQVLADDGARHRVLHVRPFPPPNPYMPDVEFDTDGVHQAASDALSTWTDARGLPGAEHVVRAGPIAREIAREADEWKADLVALGATGASRIESLLLGSTSRGVLRHTSVDTLVARGGTPVRMQRIVLATDFQAASEAAAKRALAIARRHDAQITLVHAVDYDAWRWTIEEPPMLPEQHAGPEIERAAEEGLRAFNERHLEGRAKTRLLRGRPTHEIVTLAASIGANLLVTGTRGAGALDRLLLGSVAERLVEHAPCSVLTVRG